MAVLGDFWVKKGDFGQNISKKGKKVPKNVKKSKKVLDIDTFVI